jgi:hypothetical protein
MSRLDAYRDSFPNARSKTGVLEVALHTEGGTLVFNGHTHEQFVDLFHVTPAKNLAANSYSIAIARQ